MRIFRAVVVAFAIAALGVACTTGNIAVDSSGAVDASGTAVISDLRSAAPVEDVEALSAAATDDEPQYEVTGLVLERPGSPAILCLGPVLESLPPAGCGEPTVVVEGMDWGALGVEPIREVFFAEATLIGEFDNDRFVITEPPGTPRYRPSVVNALDLTTACEPPVGGWTGTDASRATEAAMTEATAYAESQPDFAGMWVDWSNGNTGANDPRHAVLNLRFTDSLSQHEAAIRQIWGGPLCVVDGSHTSEELEAIERTLQDEIEISMSTIHPKLAAVLVRVVAPISGYSQDDLDQRFGEGAVIITSAFHPMEP